VDVEEVVGEGVGEGDWGRANLMWGRGVCGE